MKPGGIHNRQRRQQFVRATGVNEKPQFDGWRSAPESLAGTGWPFELLYYNPKFAANGNISRFSRSKSSLDRRFRGDSLGSQRGVLNNCPAFMRS
jgi:hypothetical protein